VETVVPPVETAAVSVPPPTAEQPGESSGRQFGQAPPTRTDEVQSAGAPLVRELKVGWNRLDVTGQATMMAEVLPANDSCVLAAYAWDLGNRVWRRYLPGVDVLGVNTLTEVGPNQTVWILATHRAVLRLPA